MTGLLSFDALSVHLARDYWALAVLASSGLEVVFSPMPLGRTGLRRRATPGVAVYKRMAFAELLRM